MAEPADVDPLGPTQISEGGTIASVPPRAARVAVDAPAAPTRARPRRWPLLVALLAGAATTLGLAYLVR